MLTKKLGWTDLNLSAVGLGTWAIGGSDWNMGWGPQNDGESISVIQRALELGVNWIDTAPVYGLGHSEEIIGKALKGLDNRPIIATKCGQAWDKNGNIFGRLKKENTRSEIEASLKRLKVEAIDLYQIHWPDPGEDIEEAWGVIAELIKEGKIRYAGVCNFNIEQLKRIQSIHPISSLQAPYNILNRSIERELLAYCSANNMGVVAYSPMQRGLLTGKWTKERAQNLPEDDHRSRDPGFQGTGLSAVLKLVEGLRSIAERSDLTPAQLVITWVLARPEITAAIVGARRPSQIEETVVAGNRVLSMEDVAAIEALPM